MISRYLFSIKSPEKQKECIDRHGEQVGSRYDGTKNLYLFMVKDFFVEAEFENDDEEGRLVDVKIFKNHNAVQKHLSNVPALKKPTKKPLLI